MTVRSLDTGDTATSAVWSRAVIERAFPGQVQESACREAWHMLSAHRKRASSMVPEYVCLPF